jgi:hypothetical protein
MEILPPFGESLLELELLTSKEKYKKTNTPRYVWGALSKDSYSHDELQTLTALQNRAIDCCNRVWQTVKHVLCDDSPEGHLPEELEEVEGLDTKDLLSYSFRAIHESRFGLCIGPFLIISDYS